MIDYAPWELIVPDAKARQLLVKGVLGCRPRTRTPPGRIPSVDGCTVPASDALPSRIAGRELYILYEDASGCLTERSITLRHLTPAGPRTWFMHAFCHVRESARCFRTDRVVAAFDADTGEEYDFNALLARMVAREWQVDRADLEDFVRVLVFMAYCDGRLAAEEVGAIDDAISRFVLRMDGSDFDYNQAQRFARVAAIEGIDFLAALKRLTEAQNAAMVCRLTLHAAQEVIEADFELSDSEITWHQVAMRQLRRTAML